MDVSTLTPVQLRVVDDLMARGRPRPTFAPELAARLVDDLEQRLGEVADPLGVGELAVNKRRLAQVLACEAHAQAEDAGFGGWTLSAARGTVAHKAIELSVHMGREVSALEVVDAAVERMVADARADPDDWGPGRFLASVTPVEHAELRAEVNDIVVKFQECFPVLEPRWKPRTESKARVDLCGERIALRAKVDLALGMAAGTEARVLVVDLKTGVSYPGHLDDLRYYALLHTIRTGVPPFRVASYYLDSCTFHAEDVTDDLLHRTAVDRVVDGVTRLVQLHLGHREASISPGPTCSWCQLRGTCDGARAWAAERERRGLEPED